MVKYTKITEAEGATILAQLNAGSSWVDIAKHVGHSERILKKWLAANGHAHPLHRLTNAQVADILRPSMVKNVRLGQRYAAGELLRQGYRAPRHTAAVSNRQISHFLEGWDSISPLKNDVKN